MTAKYVFIIIDTIPTCTIADNFKGNYTSLENKFLLANMIYNVLESGILVVYTHLNWWLS